MTALRARLVAALALLVTGALALPGSTAPAQADRGKPGTAYYYAAAYQYLDVPASGFQATFTVESPKQIEGRALHHSLAQIGVGQRGDSSQLEAGWIRERGKPRLFTFWRPATGKKTCYDVCGFHKLGPGKKPGAKLKPGSVLTVGFQHVGKKWWLLVNGQRSGFYRDKLWKGRTFTSTDLSQVFGEVTEDPGDPVCIDMGNGTRPELGAAARIYDVTWLGGAPTNLTVSPETDVDLYGAVLTAPNALAYGGPGAC